MIGAIMFVLLIGLMFIGVPIAFSMGLSSVIMLLINPSATMIAIVQKSVNGLDSFTTLAIPFFMMASFISGVLMLLPVLSPPPVVPNLVLCSPSQSSSSSTKTLSH